MYSSVMDSYSNVVNKHLKYCIHSFIIREVSTFHSLVGGPAMPWAIVGGALAAAVLGIIIVVFVIIALMKRRATTVEGQGDGINLETVGQSTAKRSSTRTR